jgi:pimeloyl-ACP methyl ester carboxylesterase
LSNLDNPRWIEGPQGRLSIDDGGASAGAAPVVFVHGNGGNRTQWAFQIAHLRPRRRAIALDLRGMGESDRPEDEDYSVAACADDVAAVAEALDLGRFVLVGHSFGGAVVCAYAGRHPERLAGLVFADSAGDLPDPSPRELEELRDGFLPAHYEEFTVGWFEGILARATEATRFTVMTSLRSTAREAFIGATYGLYAYRPGPDLARYAGPRLSIASVLFDDPRGIHKSLPGIPVRRIEDASHWLMLDKPEEFNGLLDEFLDKMRNAKR